MPSETYYPELRTLLETRPPERLLEITRSVRSQMPLLLTFVALSLALYVIASGSYDEQSGTVRFGALVRIMSLLPVLTLLEIVRRSFNDLYILGRDRILHRAGRLALSSSTPSLRCIDLRAISVEQGIWGRILDYGDVLLYPPGQDEPEIRLRGIRAPAELARIIDDLRQTSHTSIADRTDGGDSDFLTSE